MDEMCRTCSEDERGEECIQAFGWKYQRVRNHKGNLDIAGKIRLKGILQKHGVVWTVSTDSGQGPMNL
jgi:hypothetical protein